MAATYFNRNIPDEAHSELGKLAQYGIAVFAFTPSGGWVIVTNDGHYFARNIPDECFSELGSLIGAGHRIASIAFPPAGGNSWVIVTDKTYYARNIPDECFSELGTMWNAGARPTCIAFPHSGGNSWAILAGHSLFARNIPPEAFQWLLNYASGKSPARQIAFAPNGGFVLLNNGYYCARNIPAECFSEIGTISGQGWVVDHVAFTPTGGWSVVANVKGGGIVDPARELENRLVQSGSAWQSIWDRMKHYDVPGVSVAVALGNKLSFASSYGLCEAGKQDAVLSGTAFQAASVSKVVAAIGYHRLAQDTLVGLDEAIGPKLGWTLPVRACGQAKWRDQVTIRRLMQHNGGVMGRGSSYPLTACSGFTGDGGGYAGYADTGGVGVPTLEEILAGTSSRAGVTVNSPKVEVTYKAPAAQSTYSGPGYVVMQKLLEKQRGQTFRKWMHDHVLTPLAMTGSTYDLTPPTASTPAAAGHDAGGAVIAGKRNRYPESPAAGLYTTAADLIRVALMLNELGTLDGHQVLDSGTAKTMRQGVGTFTNGSTSATSFNYWHNGANYGFRSMFKGYPNRQAGFAVLTNGEQGDQLYPEIEQALNRLLGWP